MQLNPTYEVIVEIRSDKPIRWHSWKIGAEYLKRRIMLHIETRKKPGQAIMVGQKRGKVIHCRKMDIYKPLGNPEALPLDNARYMPTSSYTTAIAMDELIWKKRNIRRKNLYRDKNS